MTPTILLQSAPNGKPKVDGIARHRLGPYDSGNSPMDARISRHVSEQLNSPVWSTHPSGSGSSRRTRACRLH